MISFIIPVKNEACRIVTCLENIIDSCSGYIYEIIIVDNGSTDNTLDVIKDHDCRVLDGEGLTVAALRNFGSIKAKYELLAFIDADVLISRNWCDVAFNHFTEEVSSVCLGGYIDIPKESTWVEKTWHLKQEKRQPLARVTWLSSMNMVVRKGPFSEIGGFNEELITCEDVDLCNRLSQFGNIVYLESLSCIHTGEAKTIKQFFYKERWRGVGNYKSFVSNPTIRDFPSFFISFFFIFSCFLFFIGLFSNIYMLVTSVFFSSIYPVARSVFIVRKTKKYHYFFKLLFIWYLYCISRSFSVLATWQRRDSSN